jgi:hypothetical protein
LKYTIPHNLPLAEYKLLSHKCILLFGIRVSTVAMPIINWLLMWISFKVLFVKHWFNNNLPSPSAVSWKWISSQIQINNPSQIKAMQYLMIYIKEKFNGLFWLIQIKINVREWNRATNAIHMIRNWPFCTQNRCKELSALGTKSVYFLEMPEVNNYTYHSCTLTFIFLF